MGDDLYRLCPACGHLNVLHTVNPGGCVVCVVVAAAHEQAVRLDAIAARLDAIEECADYDAVIRGALSINTLRRRRFERGNR